MRNNRAGALIIRDKKLLLVTNDQTDFYWTPGGRLENNENYINALQRELNEELNLKIKSIKQYRITTHNESITAYYFLVDAHSEPNPTSDEVTSFSWFSKEELTNPDIRISPYVTDFILPELIKDDLL